MCRGLRENHKLSAVPCCGKKKCEKLYLESFPPERAVTVERAKRVMTRFETSASTQRAFYETRRYTETITAPGYCSVQNGYVRICTNDGSGLSGERCSSESLRSLHCNEKGTTCKNWKREYIYESFECVYYKGAENCVRGANFTCVEW